MSKEAMAAAAAAEPAASQEPAPEPEGGGEGEGTLSHEDAIAALSKTRKEAADLRTRSKPFREAFDGIDDSTASVVLDAVNKLKGGDVDGVRAWLDLGKRMMSDAEWDAYVGKPIPDPVEELVENADPEEKLSLHDIGRVVDERLAASEAAQRQAQAELEIQREAEKIVAQAETMGFQRGTPQFKALLDIAVTKELTLEDAKAEYEKVFPSSAPVAPPPTPKTAGAAGAGAIQTDTGVEVAAVDKLSARIDAAVAADGGLG